LKLDSDFRLRYFDAHAAQVEAEREKSFFESLFLAKPVPALHFMASNPEA
jgi:hypothetical protein